MLERSRFLQSKICEHKTLKTHKYSQSILFNCIHTAEYMKEYNHGQKPTYKLPQYNSSYFGEIRGRMSNRTKKWLAQSFSWPGYLKFLFFNMQSDIDHHCPIFSPQFLHFSNIFARSKFVQSHFFRPVTENWDEHFISVVMLQQNYSPLVSSKCRVRSR